MSKKKIIIAIFIAIASIAIIACVGVFLLDTSGKINQGNFRVNDLVVESTLEVIEQENQEVKDLESLVFDISQNNKITMLVANQAEAKSIYIDNISITNPIQLGKFYLTQNNYEQQFDIANIGSQINIYPALSNGQYRIELNIKNEQCMKDVKVSSGTKSIRYDGTILSLINTKVSDLRFDLSFDLNMIDISGKKNVCSVKLSMPDDELLTNGISVLRKNVNDFIFTIKD